MRNETENIFFATHSLKILPCQPEIQVKTEPRSDEKIRLDLYIYVDVYAFAFNNYHFFEKILTCVCVFEANASSGIHLEEASFVS